MYPYETCFVKKLTYQPKIRKYVALKYSILGVKFFTYLAHIYLRSVHQRNYVR